jgi:hypothetical protein
MDLDEATIDALLERVMQVERRFADVRKGQHSERRGRVREVIEKFAVEALPSKAD